MTTPHNDPGPSPDAVDDEPIDPAAALALIQQQNADVARQQLSGIPWILGVWGVAWGVGFLALWSGYEGGNPWFLLPLPVAGTIFGVLLVSAIVTSAVLGIRISRGVRGASGFSGAVYGFGWWAGSIAVYLLGIAFAREGASAELLSLYYPAAYGLVAGLLYFMGAALWRSVDQLVLGVIIIVASVVAPFFGAPTNNLVMALLGGGSFLVAGLVMHLNLRRGRRA
ncbi:hypothetical protein EV141_0894 [Microcella putealis]|uniref:Uncharacterized protein n=1 Tax=Microcella putealis TaxID=337005 RepID=A0A4Q7LZA9_9MICO|nr:hypothetical protein [Microcella putealis]RZS59662.1 hypothetical protein EV141_0894 [Microcella putealis]TQM26775.1 hypothetical protein BJ957_0190 [Microcella putealis]